MTLDMSIESKQTFENVVVFEIVQFGNVGLGGRISLIVDLNSLGFELLTTA